MDDGVFNSDFLENAEKVSDLLKKQPLSTAQFVNPMAQLNREMEEQRNQVIRAAEEVRRKEAVYKDAVLSALQGIESNTGSLAQIVALLKTNNDKQEQLIALITEIMSIGKAENQEEADSKYRQVMKKVTEFEGDVSSIQTLIGMANTIFGAVQGLF